MAVIIFIFLDFIFSGDNEYSLGISLNTFNQNLPHIYLDFINENFNQNLNGSYCLCQCPDNSFYIRVDNETIYEGKNTISVVLEHKTNINLLFILNLKDKILNIKNYDTNKSYGKVNIKGKSFKFFVGKCNSGDIEYNILP